MRTQSTSNKNDLKMIYCSAVIKRITFAGESKNDTQHALLTLVCHNDLGVLMTHISEGTGERV